MLQIILLFNYIPRSYSVQRLSSIDPIVNRDGPSSPSMEMGRSRPINIWLSYIFTQNGFDDLENQNRRFQLRAHWLASNPIVNRVGPSSPSMEMGPSRLINIWLSCKFTQNGFHDSQNKNHRFQLRTQPKLLDLNELINRKRAPNRHVQNLQTWTWPGDGPKPADLNQVMKRKRVRN